MDIEGDRFVEFYRLRKLVVKFSASILSVLARVIIRQGPSESYDAEVRSEKANKPIIDIFDNFWVQRYIYRNIIVVSS